MKKFVSYRRLSKEKKGRPALGLDAQKADNERCATTLNGEIAADFVEIETGKGADALERRPVLAAALQEAKRRKCPVLIARLDRLSRNVAFIAGLMEKGVPFICADMPFADPFMLHIRAAVAQQERDMIAKRTKDALAAKKAQGFTLGSPTKGAVEAERARTFAETMRPIIAPFINLSATRIAFLLNQRGHKTAEGKAWHATQVIRLCKRLTKGETTIDQTA